MEVIPAIDIRGGKCVRLTRGDYSMEKVYSGEPFSQAARFRDEGAEWMHVVDLDGAREGGPRNLDAVKRISAVRGVKTELGGGIRTMADVEAAFAVGASRLVLGTAAFGNPAFLEEALKRYRDAISVSVDVKDGKVMTGGWLKDGGIAISAGQKPLSVVNVSRVIYTDISRDGTLNGLDDLRDFRNWVPFKFSKLVFAGGVRDLDDIRKLRGMKMDGVIVGKALYEGTLSLREAVSEAA